MEFMIRSARGSKAISVQEGEGVYYTSGLGSLAGDYGELWQALTPEAQERFMEIQGFLAVAFKKAEKMFRAAAAATAGEALAKAA